MKALVTGASGFLGLYVVERLIARGDHVRAFCRTVTPELKLLDVEIVQADLRNRQAVIEACRDIDTVFHIGGIAGLSVQWRPYYETNVLGTRNVVAGCLTHGVPRLVYTSSPSVTFNGKDQKGVNESAIYPKRWTSHYAHSKALAEEYVLRHNGKNGLCTCALRPHLIWGPRDRHLVPRLLERARSGRLRKIGKGKNLIDTLYVENAAEAHLQAADALTPSSPVAGRAYFLSQGEPINCWEWLDWLLKIAGLPPTRKSMSLPVAWTFGAICELVYRIFGIETEPPMCRFLALQLASSHYFDLTSARRDFGYAPKISLEEGMRRLADYMTSSNSCVSRAAR